MARRMKKIDVLQNINLGNSIAEYDDNISQYYINTSSTLDLINDRYDIIRGVKGSGKTAMLVAICDNQCDYSQLDGKKLVKAIQLKGDPDFKRAFDTVTIEQNDLQKVIDAWKIYFINIIWKECNETYSPSSPLESYLKKEGLISGKKGILENLLYAIKKAKIKSTSTFSPDGSMKQTFELSQDTSTTPTITKSGLVDYNYIFKELDNFILSNNSCIWIMIDRLDDAFPNNTAIENIILKALFFAYKDICFYSGFKLKIFIREDIFNSITTDGFTSLTHVSAKTMKSLKWDREIIERLLVERLFFNPLFVEYIKSYGFDTNCQKLSSKEITNILYHFVKPQIDVGQNNPDTIGWIINHVKDGNGIYTPRDIIILLDTARSIQLDLLSRSNTEDISDDYLLSAPVIRKAFSETSKLKLETQLYAEYPKCRTWIETFKNQKAEHTETSLRKLLGKQWKWRTETLCEIGFFEEKPNTWKIPFIYREFLNIKQGISK